METPLHSEERHCIKLMYCLISHSHLEPHRMVTSANALRASLSLKFTHRSTRRRQPTHQNGAESPVSMKYIKPDVEACLKTYSLPFSKNGYGKWRN